MNANGQFHLQWRGQRVGPWDLAAIREALKSGTIHSLYQIHAGGQWQPLRDFLESLPRTAEATREKHKKPEAKPEVKLEETLAAETEKILEEEKEEALEEETQEKPSMQPLSEAGSTHKQEIVNSVPPPLPPPVPTWALSPAEYMKLKRNLQQPGGRFESINWHAIACLIFSLCFWIPDVGIISWLLSLVFGHIALVQISFQPSLGGRSLAMMGLAISYGVLIYGIIQIFMKTFFLLQP